MQIFVRSPNGQATSLQVTPDTLVGEIQTAIQCNEARLTYGGKPLELCATLFDYGIEDGSELQHNIELLGGGKKRKKKTYTTPKKKKHVRKKRQLAVLKYYKVDDTGKITRLRKECPQCDAGVFMASHFDRLTCGRCHSTYSPETTSSKKK